MGALTNSKTFSSSTFMDISSWVIRWSIESTPVGIIRRVKPIDVVCDSSPTAPAVRDDEETKESENNNSECVQFGEHFFVVGLSPCLTLTNSCAVVFSQPEASK